VDHLHETLTAMTGASLPRTNVWLVLARRPAADTLMALMLGFFYIGVPLGGGNADRLLDLAAELVRVPVDVLSHAAPGELCAALDAAPSVWGTKAHRPSKLALVTISAVCVR
jgi:hypothetical protein